jgi:hypothetical protein
MSWFRKVEGDVATVVAGIEKEAERLYEGVAEKVRETELDLVKHIEALFALAAQEGKKLELKIASAGHFNADGTGSATLQINSQAVDIPAVGQPPAPDTPTAAPEGNA